MTEILFSTKEISEIETNRDLYGFKKTLVALTDFGKVIGFSSFNGGIIWTSDYS